MKWSDLADMDNAVTDLVCAGKNLMYLLSCKLRYRIEFLDLGSKLACPCIGDPTMNCPERNAPFYMISGNAGAIGQCGINRWAPVIEVDITTSDRIVVPCHWHAKLT